MFKKVIFLALLCQVVPLNAQESDIVGFWNQPAPGLSLGGVAALFGFSEDAIERADGPPVVDFRDTPQ